MQRHFIPRRPWSPLSDAEWAALAPHLPRAALALRALGYRLCRAAPSAMRLLGLAGLDPARRLRLLTAPPMLPVRGLPRTLPNRLLSESLLRLADPVLARSPERWPPRGPLARRALATARGHSVQSKKFAPP